MWYAYKTNSNGIAILSKAFEYKADCIKYALRTPKEPMYISNREPDLLGRAYSGDPAFNKAN